MKSHQLFSAISPALQQEIINYLQTETREAFRTALYQIGAQKKFRPQYFQTKTREQQASWLLDHLKMKAYDGVSEQILQLWLLKAKTTMLVSFLDAADIKHDGNGQVDDLPAELASDKVEAGIEAMLKDHPAEQVSLYLNVFQLQRPGGWSGVGEALTKRADMKLGA
jgi:hypothetical protein